MRIVTSTLGSSCDFATSPALDRSGTTGAGGGVPADEEGGARAGGTRASSAATAGLTPASLKVRSGYGVNSMNPSEPYASCALLFPSTTFLRL